MPTHPVGTVRQVAMSIFFRTPVKTLRENITELSVVNFLSLEASEAENMTAVTNRAAAWQTRDGGALEVDVLLLAADVAGTIRSVQAIIANLDSMREVCWVGAVKPLLIQAAVFIFDKVQEADVQEYTSKLDKFSKVKLSYHLISCLAWLASGIQGVSLDYENITAIADGNLVELKNASYSKIVKRFSRDMRDFESAVCGGAKPNPSFSIMPVVQANKKPCFAQELPTGGEAPRNAQWQGNYCWPTATMGSQRGHCQGDGRQAPNARKGGARGGFGGGVGDRLLLEMPFNIPPRRKGSWGT